MKTIFESREFLNIDEADIVATEFAQKVFDFDVQNNVVVYDVIHRDSGVSFENPHHPSIDWIKSMLLIAVEQYKATPSGKLYYWGAANARFRRKRNGNFVFSVFENN